jgi:uncharacterized damage-inducible protein DinB
METKELFAYGDALMRRLRETLQENPEGFVVTFETISAFKGVKGLIAHMIGAEDRWYDRVRGLTSTTRYEDNPASTVGGLFAEWQSKRDRLKDYYFGLDAAALLTPIPQKFPFKEEPTPMTIDAMIYHLINHQTYHTGQISMALQQTSIDPPNFDYVALML